MDQNTKQVIDSLFERLQKAEAQNSNRDSEAQSLIEKHLVAHPTAPYYMAQTMIMQEATIKQLHQRLEALEAQQQAQPRQSGGFLSGLFGGNHQSAPQGNPNTGWNQRGAQPNYNQPANGQSNYGQPNYPPQGGGFGRGNSFLGGALQTAAGVAGGVVLGNMMMDMFSHHQSQDIVNIINDNPTDMNADMNNGVNDPTNQFADGMDNNGQDASFDQGLNNDSGFADNQGGFDNGMGNGFADNQGGFDNGVDSGFDDPFSGGGFDGGGWDDGGGFDDFNS
ncbi:DUF2076 domain-containing protein [Celerinatantimonas yamalensis]|uniref:DUF2076 domain-containing protein n=1 Tax=Celerinatantimonas yamalensis TaxID=559956 RepID=A0ABW9GAZ3_9GAMM